MPRAHWEDGAEIVRNDLNAVSKALQRELYDRVILEMLQRKENAFFDDSFLVSFSSANQVIVKKGTGFQSDNTQVSPEPQKRLLYLGADVSKVISSPDSVNDRIDIVCVKAAIVDELTGSRKYKDATTSVISTQNLVVQKDWLAEVLIVDGVPAISPVAPAVPVGYLKIAELQVTAVSGLSGAGAITDNRLLFPIAGAIALDTTGKLRITAGASTSLDQIVSDIDAFLHRGKFNYFDVEEINSPTAEPGSPAAGLQRAFYRDNVLYLKNSSGSKTPVGSGAGGGGGGANWQPVAGGAPIEDYEFDEKVWLFEKDSLQSLVLWVRVPSGYVPGRKVSMVFGSYSPSAANNWRLQAVTSLIRKNNDAISSFANSNSANSGDLTNTVSNRLREVAIDLSSSVGTINSVAISPGDLLKVVLTRVAPGAGAEDTDDIRFIPSSTEVSF